MRVGVRKLRAAEPAAALDSRPQAALGAPAELVRSGHDRAAQLHERLATNIDRTSASDHQQPQRLPSLPFAWQREILPGEHRPGRSGRVQLVVFAVQPPLTTRTTAGLDHRFAAAAQMTSKAGTVMTCTLNRPHAPADGVFVGEPKRLRVAARRSPPTVASQPRRTAQPRPRARARRGGCRRRPRNPPDLQASLLILDFDS